MLPKSSVLLCFSLWAKLLNAKVFIKKCFPLAVGSVCHSWVEKHGKCFIDDEEVETEVRKWLRQKSKYLYAAGFDALLERWHKSVNVKGYVEK
jgi:hypothetical protein